MYCIGGNYAKRKIALAIENWSYMFFIICNYVVSVRGLCLKEKVRMSYVDEGCEYL